jgi:hypothetical protein
MSTGGQAEQNRNNIVEIASRLLLRHHVDAWHALGAAQLMPVEKSLLRLFALQDWGEWKRIEPVVIAGMEPCWYATQAAADGMSRILWLRADVPLEVRALDLRVRAMDYRRAVRQAEALLRAWMHMAALGYLVTLSGRDGFTTASRHTDQVEQACPPTRPRAVPRQGQQLLKRAA